jgi:gliding motility-associated-like protein/uncharacterized repeat protein (TIGR01451 family)
MGIRKLTYLILLFLQFAIAKAQTQNEIRVPLGTPVTLGTEANGNYSYQWFRDGQPIANATAATYRVTVAGVYQVRATNSGDCQSDLSDGFLVFFEYSDLEVLKRSELRPVGPNETFDYQITARNKGNTANTNIVVTDQLPSNLRYMGANSQAASYLNGIITWNIPSLRVNEEQTLVIQVQGKMEGQVTNTATISGQMPDPDMDNNSSTDGKRIIGNLKIPNVITPNGDGKNDVFRVEGIELYKENTLSIFNRWGNEVYRSNGYTNNWNGDGLSEGTYYYVLKLVSREGTSSSATGWITLLRDK